MNDIDIEEGRRYQRAWSLAFLDRAGTEAAATIRLLTAEIERLRNNAAAMFDAIETGRQWETIARQAEEKIRLPLAYLRRFFPCPHWTTVESAPSICANCGMDNGESCPIRQACDEIEAAVKPAAFRDVADRTPDPHHDGI